MKDSLSTIEGTLILNDDGVFIQEDWSGIRTRLFGDIRIKRIRATGFIDRENNFIEAIETEIIKESTVKFTDLKGILKKGGR